MSIRTSRPMTAAAAPPPTSNGEFSSAMYSHMDPLELIQAFKNMLEEIDPDQKANIRSEDRGETTVRILEFLRILKYMPSEEDPTTFRLGIAEGDPDVIVPIMRWIFERKDDLKKRAYLAKFLVRIELPPNMCRDEETLRVYDLYESLIEKFVTLHKEYTMLKSQPNVTNLLENIEKSEYDLDCLRRRIDTVKARMERKPNKMFQLSDAQALRAAKEKRHDLIQQLRVEEQYFQLAQEKRAVSQKEFQRISNMFSFLSPESIIEHLGKEISDMEKLVTEVFPKEVKSADRCIQALKTLETQPPKTIDDINYLKSKIAKIKHEVSVLENLAKPAKPNGLLFMARQKAKDSALKRKSISESAQNKAEELNKVTEEYNKKYQDRIRRLEARERDDLKLKEYRTKIENKEDKYDKKQKELQFIISESGTLASTKFILEGKFWEGEENLEAIEDELGITGLTKTQEKLGNLVSAQNALEAQNHEHIVKLSEVASKYEHKIKAESSKCKKLSETADRRHKRAESIKKEYEILKANYEKCLSEAESENVETAKKIEVLKSQLSEDELKYFELKALNLVQKEKKKIALQEKLHQTREKNGTKDDRIRSLTKNDLTRSHKQKLLGKLVEQERIGAALKLELENMEAYQSNCALQRQMWGDVIKMVESKLRSKTSEPFVFLPVDEYETPTQSESEEEDEEL